MAGDDKILSQSEIDALLSKAPSKPRPKPPAAGSATTKQTEPPKQKAAPPLEPMPKVVPLPLKPVEPEDDDEEVIEVTPKAKAVPPPEPSPKIKVAPPPEAPPKAAAPPPKAATPPPLPKAVPPPPRVVAPPPAMASGPAMASYKSYASDEVANLKETVAELVRHVVKLTGAMQRIDRLEEKMEQIVSVIKLSPDAPMVLERRIDEIRRAIEEIRQNSVRDEFQCNKCRSTKAVAVHVKCTTCGNESWMGWWPEAEHKDADKPENSATAPT